MAAPEEIKARIRALLARTEANGCTEAEAMAAAARAFALMREHGLHRERVECGRAEVLLGRARRTESDGLWLAVAHACRCEMYYRMGTTRSVVYLGRLPWPEVAGWLHGVVAGAAARATREFKAGPEFLRYRLDRSRTMAVLAFQRSFAEAFSLKIRALLDTSDPALVEDRRAAQAALEAEGPMSSAPAGRTPGLDIYEGAISAGLAAGSATSVAWGINGPAATRLIGGRRG